MITMRIAAAAAGVALALASVTALAEGPRASSANTIVQTAGRQPMANQSGQGRYQWQYHYVGRHLRFEGYWVLVP